MSTSAASPDRKVEVRRKRGSVFCLKIEGDYRRASSLLPLSFDQRCDMIMIARRGTPILVGVSDVLDKRVQWNADTLSLSHQATLITLSHPPRTVYMLSDVWVGRCLTCSSSSGLHPAERRNGDDSVSTCTIAALLSPVCVALLSSVTATGTAVHLSEIQILYYSQYVYCSTHRSDVQTHSQLVTYMSSHAVGLREKANLLLHVLS